MAAGVNYNTVWAALGKPVSVLRGREEDHHIGGSDASGIVWKVGEGVTRWKPGDEVVVHCNQASYEDVEVHGLDPLAAPSQRIWGYETTWGSFAQFTKVQAQQRGTATGPGSVDLRSETAELLGACPGEPITGQIEVCQQNPADCEQGISGSASTQLDGSGLYLYGGSDPEETISGRGDSVYVHSVLADTMADGTGSLEQAIIFSTSGEVYCAGAGTFEWAGVNGTRLLLDDLSQLGPCSDTATGSLRACR
jgi:hypothetical protein